MDLVVLLPNSFGAALDAWLAGARWRVGYATDGRSALLTHAVPAAHAWQHQVDAYLALHAPLGIEPAETRPRLVVPAERRAEARELLGRVGLRPGEPAVAIQLGAAFGPSKLWASDRLAELARRLDVRGVPVVFLGAPSAAPLLRAVEAHLGARPATLVGEDHPAVLPALLAEFAVVVAPDSGPAHVAAAVGVPGVTLFGPTDPRLSAPRGPGQAALWHSPVCAPCFLPRCPLDHRCLGRLSVEEGVDRVWEHLRARAAAE
jgi:heptosyltransferase-2